jgi:hypothetical protein
MTQILDARGNPFRGLLDAITGETITDARAPTASLGALAAESVVDLNGASIVFLDLRSAAFTGTVVFEGTVDGTNYVALAGLNGSNPIALLAGAGVVNSQVVVGVSGYRRFRIRVSLYTSGALTVALRASCADYAITAVPLPATLCVTATGLVNAAVTLTIPLVASMFHYITRLTVQQFFATAGLAGATPALVTTTNLPGTLAFSFPTAGALGTMVNETLSPAQPIKATAAGVNTTVVAPARTDTIWRITAHYGLGN